MSNEEFSVKINTRSEEEMNAWTQEYVRTYMSYEQEIDQRRDEIKEYRSSFKEWEKDFLDDKPIPKKELTQAVQILKKNLDHKMISQMVGSMEKVVED